jgi:tRNA 2-selenouridine synthase
LPGTLKFRVIAGPTGSGKSRLLEALAAQGAQILHLEALAAHKGSVLGNLPDAPQPSQKMFETRLYAQLLALNPGQPTFIEAESRRIGQVTLPGSMIDAIRSSPCLRVQAGMAARVDFLMRDYDYLLDASRLQGQIALLKGLQSRETIDRWQALAARGEFRTLVAELLQQHYDPLYARSQRRSFSGFDAACLFETDVLDSPSLGRLAGEVIQRCRQD